eukprot:Plantae.Rhodophyta-Purpureofilum_apyrenoidigerum.ctg12247.p1 GENE.Plantae.Rhodophyta-Purpureofilum_apyrenoidigerum.ctg12247~~Plantae.Rhodophyta-Purpureofilum_apyrenoidigerum.ctg12247.p1  ORF type:complete len:221 (-),score=17.49 Plantae.Rhodophyta-Purpureofilum_apyrenoidigerum.ctg12247:136-765(-)
MTEVLRADTKLAEHVGGTPQGVGGVPHRVRTDRGDSSGDRHAQNGGKQFWVAQFLSASTGMLVEARLAVFMSKRPKKMDILFLTQNEPAVARQHEVFCEICGRGFVKVSTMRDHMRTHTGERVYHCSVPGCNRSFKWRSSLSQHRRRHRKRPDEILAEAQESLQNDLDAPERLPLPSTPSERVPPEACSERYPHTSSSLYLSTAWNSPR